MFIIGLILLIVGYVLGIGVLETVGLILLLVGVVLFVVGAVGHPVGGRRYWF